VRGSAKQALDSTSTDPNAPEYASIRELLRVIDEYIPEPKRDTEKPFMMSVEDVFSIGRGMMVDVLMRHHQVGDHRDHWVA
jgi:elongation factor Tu